jgi:hypothetical protein
MTLYEKHPQVLWNYPSRSVQRGTEKKMGLYVSGKLNEKQQPL